MAGLPQDRPIPGSPLLDPIEGTPAPPIPNDPIAIPQRPPSGLPPAVPGPVADAAGMAPELPPGPPAEPQPLEVPEPLAPLPPEQIGQGPDAELAGAPGLPMGMADEATESAFPPDHWFGGKTVGKQVESMFGAARDAAEIGRLEEEKKAKAARAQAAAEAKAEQDMLAKMSPEQRKLYLHNKEMEQLQANKMAAEQEIADAKKAKNAYLSAEGARIAADANEANARAERQMEEAYQEARKNRQALDVEAIKIANTKIDPNRAMDNLSFGKSVAMVVAAGLQGWQAARANAKTGGVGAGQNITDLMHSMVERDMKAQQADVANRQAMLGFRRDNFQDQWQADKDMRDYRYKSAATYYEMAKNQMEAISLQFDNPRIDAEMALKRADADIWISQERDKYEASERAAKLAADEFAHRKAHDWYTAKTGRMGVEEQKRANQAQENAEKNKGPSVQERKLEAEIEEKSAARKVTDKQGNEIGRSDTPDDAKAANRVVLYSAQMEKLAETGVELFKDGFAPEGTTQRAKQKAWITDWSTVHRYAGGDTSAPSDQDRANWGVDDSKWIANNPDVIYQQLDTARDLGQAVLEKNRITKKDRARMGFIPVKNQPQTSRTAKVLYVDENGIVSEDRSGSPMTPEATEEFLQRQAFNEARAKRKAAGEAMGEEVKAVPITRFR